VSRCHAAAARAAYCPRPRSSAPARLAGTGAGPYPAGSAAPPLPMTHLPGPGRLRASLARHGRLIFLLGLAAGYWVALFGSALPDSDEPAGRVLVRLAGSLVELWFIGLLLAGC